MDELLELLGGVRPDVDFGTTSDLIDAGVLDSFDIIVIVNELGEKFGVEIDIADLEPANFNSASAMWELVQKLRGQAGS